jgi:ribose 5-phosphate isomerase
MNENTEAGAIAALAAKASGAHVVKTDDNREFLIVPSGFSEKEVSDAYGLKLAKPKYIKQTVTIETADSLVDYVNRFKGADTMLFAEISSNRIVALVDYHAADGRRTSRTAPSSNCRSPRNGSCGPRSAAS